MRNLGNWDIEKAEDKNKIFFLPQSSMTSAPDTQVKSQKAKAGTECRMTPSGVLGLTCWSEGMLS